MKRKARRINPPKQNGRSKGSENSTSVTGAFGFNVPPALVDVFIYFDQKDAGEVAQKFVDEQEKWGWKARSGKPIRNWKVFASDWIFNYKQEENSA